MDIRTAISSTALPSVVLVTACQPSKPSGTSIHIGLRAPLSGPLAARGQAIQRETLLAMEEQNRKGGALGRPLAFNLGGRVDVESEAGKGSIFTIMLPSERRGFLQQVWHVSSRNNDPEELRFLHRKEVPAFKADGQ